MARKYNLFNFLERKTYLADISGVTQSMIDQIAFKELALFIGISYIANTLSKCEFKTFENGKETRGRLWYMLNVSPNPNQNSSQFINKMIEQYYYHGHALVVPHIDDNIYCADNFYVDDTNPLSGNTFTNVTFGAQTVNRNYRASDVFYIQLDNKNARGLVESLYQQYGALISQAISAYKRTNGAKYKLLLDQYRAGDPEFKKQYDEVIKNQLKTFFENDNAIYPQYRGFDLQEFSQGNAKSADDIITMRKEIFDTTAQALKIPLTMMYGNITNMNDVVKVYLSICIDPLADMIGEEFTRKYYSFDEWQKGNRVEVDTSCINHVDILEVSDKLATVVSSGVTNIDELRKRLNLPELGTEFSTSHFITKNYALAEDFMSGAAGGGE